MVMSRIVIRTLLLVLVLTCASLAWAADFTQAERDVDFIKACRRQDGKLTRHLGELLSPANMKFFHLGSYKATIHRDGLDRALWLVPVKSLPYTDLDEMRSAARGNPISVGALITAYSHSDPKLTPGTFVLMYDGLRVRLVDPFEYQVNQIKVALEPAPADDELDPALGTVTGTAFSQACIEADGDLLLYLQLTGEGSEPLMDEDGFVKLKLTIPIPGIATDDDSPDRDLAEPAEEEEE